MSRQGKMMIDQEVADALNYMGEAEWRDMYNDQEPKRKVGRPRKSEEEKKAAKAAYNKKYWKKWVANMSEEQKAKRREQTRASHDKWYQEHKEEWSAYMREYRAKKKLDNNKQV